MHACDRMGGQGMSTYISKFSRLIEVLLQITERSLVVCEVSAVRSAAAAPLRRAHLLRNVVAIETWGAGIGDWTFRGSIIVVGIED